ncbi:hypothetical protein BJ878DRAFT_87627 [Calycina marina]|uniref:Transmembrane protein n=1 Tax=Calycina marina TaxID=1763456 RepID=A0A9P7Z2G4_9HELO|nr:hypothetical protein BJ878DRAFT_87627 [Calycina marina]
MKQCYVVASNAGWNKSWVVQSNMFVIIDEIDISSTELRTTCQGRQHLLFIWHLVSKERNMTHKRRTFLSSVLSEKHRSIPGTMSRIRNLIAILASVIAVYIAVLTAQRIDHSSSSHEFYDEFFPSTRATGSTSERFGTGTQQHHPSPPFPHPSIIN